MPEDGVISTRQAANQLGVSVRTIQLWVDAGELKAWTTAGNHRRIYQSSVDRMIRLRQGLALEVLVVEDDPITQAYYQELFSMVRPELKVIYANNGFEGLIHVGERKPDLMIADIDMPHMNGMQMIASLKEITSVNALSIAVVTGLDADQLDRLGELPQQVPVFHKPLSVTDFNTILELLPGEQYLIKEVGDAS